MPEKGGPARRHRSNPLTEESLMSQLKRAFLCSVILGIGMAAQAALAAAPTGPSDRPGANAALARVHSGWATG